MASSEGANIALVHSLSSQQVLAHLKVDINKGLSASEVAARLHQYGPNELPKPEKESIWEKIKEQFEDLLVRILCLAAVISFIVSCFGKYL